MNPSCRLFFAALILPSLLPRTGTAADPVERIPAWQGRAYIARSDTQPAEFRYLAFPAVLRTGDDEIWVAYKAGVSHGTDSGAALEVARHQLSSGASERLGRFVAPKPKLFQMGEWARYADGSITLNIDVQAIGHDGRHYRTGAEVIRWDASARRFAAPVPLGPIGGITYGYPFEFITEGQTTWQLIMGFGYMQSARWSVDVVRTEDRGANWSFVRNLSQEFGELRLNETGFVRYKDGFLVSTRGYDRHERLHWVDRDFRLRRQVDLTETYAFIQNHIGRPRLFLRDGRLYLIGRNYTRPADKGAERGGTPGAMKLCLFGFNPDTLAMESWAVLDNAEEDNVTDGYYAVPVFTGSGSATRLHAITYKAKNRQPPDIIRLDYRWDEVR